MKTKIFTAKKLEWLNVLVTDYLNHLVGFLTDIQTKWDAQNGFTVIIKYTTREV